MRLSVSNASPLIVLAKAGLIGFLPSQFHKVLIPNAVWEELQAGPEDDPIRTMLVEMPWLVRVRLEPSLSPLARWNLGPGESEVIEYARRHPNTVALLDDRSARKAAEAMNIKVCGTLSIVARQVNINPTLRFDTLVKLLRDAGMYANDKVIGSVKERIGKA